MRPAAAHNMVYAEGQPIDLAIAMQAAEWLTTLMSGQATPAEKTAWTDWRQSHPDHERAWRHIEKVSGGFQGLDGQASRQALARRSRSMSAGGFPVSRRGSLKALSWLAAIGLTGWQGARSQPAQTLLADASTTTGQRRDITLPDGTQLTLNSGSAVNLRYSSTQRLLQLVQGEVFISTAQEVGQPYRPFLVETAHGQALALGTRYSVRQDEDYTSVAVEQGAVRLTPRHGGSSVIIHAGQASSMTAERIAPAQTVSPDVWGWRRGLLLADDMSLRDFLHELSRYRHGFLGCDDSVADLRISGVFPLHDLETVLLSLPDTLPVKLRLRTRYWMQVEARTQNS
ncbi:MULTISPECIES: FecR domain-containing protein [unclassified Janthinobacterium]|uniref:FecR domain-containing protein n=1 Tax=unclassified Janthinobacterium TaxID=2610881 RepID=UPI00161B25EC|nr:MULTISPECIES: FecR domain-containing protein [unclassified Janthinobacterium]MBB5369070.1 transmembrane sensor [Janthinobacterium sp. K2C7]MBB5381393.1 transmembrane sensor [Janthinobacterium sp. K2Li3]MBB5387453.1 transmembrane sensor [Janthinobacterium sp. K2E3]